MTERTEYLNLLKSWKDEKVIKIITGIRRCGKSTLLKQFSEYLISTGVSPERIISVNFENLEYEELTDYRKLYSYIKDKLCDNEMTYIMLDEIQQVRDFQKAIDSLYIKDNTDLYVTGSNAYLLSGEIATLLSGRYIEINMLPFSFKEYREIKKPQDSEKCLAQYLQTGAFPYIASLENYEEKSEMYLDGIFNTIIIKDIEERQKRRETDPDKRKVTDIVLLKNITKFLAGSVGSPVSPKSIADYITSAGRKVSQNTVNGYLEALTEPYIFYYAERYDVLGKQLLKTNGKYYIADLGLLHYLLPRKHYDLGFSLENTVYLELRRRGYRVNIGKAGNNEIDFIARKKDTVEYYQVTASMTEESTFEREMKSLRAINDNYKKTVITLDKYTVGNYDGIEVVNAVDWLLG